MNKPLTQTTRNDMKQASSALQQVAEQFALSITPAMKKLIDPADKNDPIAAQFIPSLDELFVHPEEIKDPISDFTFSPVEGIVHRHTDRVLLKLLNVCAVHCRFCFRREQIGVPENSLSEAALTKAIDYIAEHKEIWEVILTGGDPLVLSDRRIEDVIARLNAIEHVKIIRIHTRLPVVNPARITPALINSLKGRAPIYILLHCNHARELTPEAIQACGRLIDAGMPMLSQSVLLRGVNNNIETLTQLMRSFVENRIKPHYIHHGDLARGTSHFRTTIAEGQKLMRGLRDMSGLCQPTYLLDIPGGHGKVSLEPSYIEKTTDGWSLEDTKGKRHDYRDVVTETPATKTRES
jgi:lysine 2,3-aminomutase